MLDQLPSQSQRTAAIRREVERLAILREVCVDQGSDEIPAYSICEDCERNRAKEQAVPGIVERGSGRERKSFVRAT